MCCLGRGRASLNASAGTPSRDAASLYFGALSVVDVMGRLGCVVMGECERGGWSGQQFLCLVDLFIAVEGKSARVRRTPRVHNGADTDADALAVSYAGVHAVVNAGAVEYACVSTWLPMHSVWLV